MLNLKLANVDQQLLNDKQLFFAKVLFFRLPSPSSSPADKFASLDGFLSFFFLLGDVLLGWVIPAMKSRVLKSVHPSITIFIIVSFIIVIVILSAC